MQPTQPPADRAGFPRRQVELALDAPPPADWYAGDGFLTRFWEALSLLFPRGEAFFVESVRHYRRELRDPTLLAEVEAFIGQEAMHGKEHRALNRHVAERYPVAARLDRELAWLLARARAILSPKSRLAVTCALEHFTAIMAEQLMAVDAHQNAAVPQVRPLWLWHALEESEHKAVAFDVYRAVDGRYPRRVLIMLITTLIFIAFTVNVHARLLASEGKLLAPRAWLRGVAFFWLKPGLFRRMLPAYFAYFRPGFHPNDRDARDLTDRIRARLFGPGGPLEGKVHETWSEAKPRAA